MNKFLAAFITAAIVSLKFASFSFPQNNDSLTIITYYPIPFGNYDQLGVDKLAVDVNGMAAPGEYADMRSGDVHIGRSLIIGPSYSSGSSGSSTGFSYAQLNLTGDNRPANGSMLIEGFMGIGTTRPLAGLHILGNASNNASEFSVENSVVRSGGKYSFHINENGHLSIREVENYIQDRFVITGGNAPGFIAINGDSGNIGIGTSTPQARLDIVGGGVKISRDQYCTSNKAGSLMYNSSFYPPRMEYCNVNSTTGVESWSDYTDSPYGWVQIPPAGFIQRFPAPAAPGEFDERVQWPVGAGDVSAEGICRYNNYTTFTGACWTPLNANGTGYICQGSVKTDLMTGAGRLSCVGGDRTHTNLQTKILCVK